MDHKKEEAIKKMAEFDKYFWQRNLLAQLNAIFKHDEIIRYFEQKGYHQFRKVIETWKANIDKFDVWEAQDLSQLIGAGWVAVIKHNPELKKRFVTKELADDLLYLIDLEEQLEKMVKEIKEKGFEITPLELGYLIEKGVI